MKGKDYDVPIYPRNPSYSSIVILVFARSIFKVEARVRGGGGRRATSCNRNRTPPSAAYSSDS
jgi:hypothetical protein